MRKQNPSKLEPSAETQTTSLLSSLSPRSQLPTQIPTDMDLVFGFNVSTSQIMDLFQSIADQEKYELIESEQNHATAIKHGKKSFMQIIDCFNWWTEGNVTAIKMTVKTREKDSKRICRIRGLVGSRKEIVDFIEKFQMKSISLSASKQNLEQDELQINEQQTNPFYLESCASFMFHKILSNQKYGIGNFLFVSINNFNKEFQNFQESVSLLPLPMKKAVSIAEEVVSNLYKDFNFGRHQMEQIMPYCRISVQKYVFEKVHDTITKIYVSKNEKIVKDFIEKKNKILNSMTPKHILREIGLSERLWISDVNDPDLQKVGNLLKSKPGQAYRKATKELQKIEGTQSPRQKIKHCQIMFTILKTIIFEGTNKKEQLFNMEDIIPILILTLLITNIHAIKNQLDFMLDFTGFDSCELQSETRLLVNMSESFNYVSRDWNIQ